jgi:hypothetical protein
LHTSAACAKSYADERVNPSIITREPVTFATWSINFSSALLIVGPRKINTNSLRQTFGEQFLEYVFAFEFSNKKACLSDALATIQTPKIFAQESDVITYPLIQETFA